MGICEKIFIINLHNLQMLFMLWIKNKFSEHLVPLHKLEGPQCKTYWRRFYPNPQTGGNSEAVTLKSFLCLIKFCCAQKNLFQTCDKNRNLSPLKMCFSPKKLKPGYRPGSAKIVSVIRIFCFEGQSASRCSIT